MSEKRKNISIIEAKKMSVFAPNGDERVCSEKNTESEKRKTITIIALIVRCKKC